MPNDTLQRIGERQDRYITSVVSGYTNVLQPIVQRSLGRLFVTLNRSLRVDAQGKILPTAANQAIIRRLDSTFMGYMDDLGYGRLTESFVNAFDGQLPFFHDILQSMGLEVPSFSARDLKAFGGVKLATMATLEDTLQKAGANAVRNAAFMMNGLPYSDLVDSISTQLGKSVQESASIGATGMATYYRNVSNRGFQVIEDDLGIALGFTYVGPNDKLIRPFCKRMMAQAAKGKTWTREQIDRLNNGSSLSNVMTNCGGWNCRHQWVIALNASKNKRRRKHTGVPGTDRP